LFITMAKEGSTIGGLMDSFATTISICLQYGVPLKALARKFTHARFEPSGFTKNPDIPTAKSIVDYIFRWMELQFAEAGEGEAVEVQQTGEQTADAPPPEKAVGAVEKLDSQFEHFMEDAPPCDNCGSITVRNGACYRCYNCGASMGCS
jgi:ribonucleoside-diphosphate reductase alpha chain